MSIGKKSLRLSETWHDFLYVIRKNAWLLVLFLILFTVLIPFSTAGLPGDSMFSVEYTHDQVKYRFLHESAQLPVLASAVVMGVVCGMALFGFLLNKRDTTMYLSLGLTRGCLFANRVVAGSLSCVISVAVPMLISLALNRMAVGGYQCEIRDCLYLIWGLCVLALVVFFVTLAACMLSGTVAETLICTVAFLAAPSMVFYSVNLIAKQFFWGNAWGVTNQMGTAQIEESLLSKFDWANPVLFFQTELANHSVFVRPNEDPVPPDLEPAALIGWTVAAAGLLVLSYFLFRIRKAENAGISGANSFLAEVVIGLSALPVFSLAVTFLGRFGVVLGLVFGYALFAVVHLFWRKALFCGALKKRSTISLAVQALVPTALCCLFAFGCSARCGQLLNAPEQFAKVSVSFVGSPNYLYEEAAGSSSRGYYVVSRLELSDVDAIRTAAAIQQDFLEKGRREQALNEEDISETVVPYDISFCYTTEDGKEYHWYYDRASLSQLAALLELEDEEEVREEQTRLFTDVPGDTDSVIWANEAYQNGAVYLTDSLYRNTWELTLDEEGRAELLEALAADLASQPLSDRYFPDTSASSVLMFTQNAEYDLTYYSYHLDNAFIYLTDAFVNTKAFLEKYGLADLTDTQPEITSVVIQEFNPYDSVNGLNEPFSLYFMAYRADSDSEFLIQKDFGKEQVITDEERIGELRKAMHNNYFMSGGGYLAAVMVSGCDTWVYEFIPYADAPDFLKRTIR